MFTKERALLPSLCFLHISAIIISMKELLGKVPFLFLLAILVIANACGTEVTSSPTTSTPTTTSTSVKNTTKTKTTTTTSVTPIPGKVKTTRLSQDGITLTISTNKETYVPGETVVVTASVENTTANTITYFLANIGDPTPAVYLSNNANFRGFALEEKGFSRTVIPAYTSGQLKPHQTVSREVVWDQKAFSPTLSQAPNGRYNIGCGITLGDYFNEASLKNISCNFDIFIVGDATWTTAEQAKNTALNLPDVAKWLIDHSGENIAKIVDGNYFITYNDLWQQITPDFKINNLSFSELQNSLPDMLMEYQDDNLILTWKSRYGMKPHMVKVWINLKNGSVTDKQFFDKVS